MSLWKLRRNHHLVVQTKGKEMNKMSFRYTKLRSLMMDKKVTIRHLAAKTGIHEQTLYNKLSRGQRFDCEQAWRIAQVLGITDMDPYFFDIVL